jgi:hypothetical protein
MHKISAEPTQSAHVSRAEEYPVPTVESIAAEILSMEKPSMEKQVLLHGSAGQNVSRQICEHIRDH